MKLWGQLWTTLHSFCTQSFILFRFSFDTCVFMARLHDMPCRIHPCLSYLDFREGNCLSHDTSGKTWNFIVQNIYGELSTTCHHFKYRPLVIARFQRAVTSLFFAWFCSNFHWLFSIMKYFIIKVNLICGFWFPLTLWGHFQYYQLWHNNKQNYSLSLAETTQINICKIWSQRPFKLRMHQSSFLWTHKISNHRNCRITVTCSQNLS